jgi:hypothetical protein
MHGFTKIAVIGDSFCRHQENKTDWPIHLGTLLGVDSFGKGNGGNSWWTARRFLKRYYSTNTSDVLLIVVHTQYTRLPNDYELPISMGVLKTTPTSSDNEMAESDPDGHLHSIAKNFYMSNLFSKDFYEWAQQTWIKELDDNADKFFKVIHIPAFDMVRFNVKNSMVLQPSPGLLSLRTLSDSDRGESLWFGPDERRNHFSEHNNIKLAETIAYTIRNTNKDYTGTLYFNNLDKWDFKPGWPK